jgi:hypothetical protein
MNMDTEISKRKHDPLLSETYNGNKNKATLKTETHLKVTPNFDTEADGACNNTSGIAPLL